MQSKVLGSKLNPQHILAQDVSKQSIGPLTSVGIHAAVQRILRNWLQDITQRSEITVNSQARELEMTRIHAFNVYEVHKSSLRFVLPTWSETPEAKWNITDK